MNPDNVYGASKRIGELLVTALGRRGATTFAAVRFGNVMGSRGSVVPLFLRQIERGGPVLITDPETTRYQMSVEEAAALVIQAASFAREGQIFLLDMGEKIRTADLAEKMIRLKGLEPGRDIKIVYTGLRPGEKLHEELLCSAEKLYNTHHPKIFLTEGRTTVTPDGAGEQDQRAGEQSARRPRRGRRPPPRPRPHRPARHRADAPAPARRALDAEGHRPSAISRRRLRSAAVKLLTVVGARPQFIKAAAFSRVARQRHTRVLVHTGQHYDARMSDVFFDELALPRPDHHLGVGSGRPRLADGADARAARGRDARAKRRTSS